MGSESLRRVVDAAVTSLSFPTCPGVVDVARSTIAVTAPPNRLLQSYCVLPHSWVRGSDERLGGVVRVSLSVVLVVASSCRCSPVTRAASCAAVVDVGPGTGGVLERRRVNVSDSGAWYWLLCRAVASEALCG